MAELTRARVCQLFNYDPETGQLLFKERERKEFANGGSYTKHLKRVGKPSGYTQKDGYVSVKFDGNKHRAHRVIWLIVHGELPRYPDMQIDHINGNPTDNRISNLRVVTQSENMRNIGISIKNRSGVKGVHWVTSEKKWQATIRVEGKTCSLGCFDSLDDAAFARKKAEEKNGFIVTNRPSRVKLKMLEAAA